MKLKAKCAAVVPFNGIVKVLLTTESAPSSQDEHLLCNLLKDRMEWEPDRIYAVEIYPEE
jgi:hypothetical protein